MIARFFIILLKGYQKVLSPETGYLWSFLGKTKKTCVFFPSCSEYMIQAIKKHGAIRGLLQGVRRVLRCHPWQKEHFDPVK